VILSSEENSQGNLNLVMAKRDTGGPSLLGCQLLDKNKLQLELDEEPDSFSLFELKNYEIVCETDDSQFAKVNGIYLPAGQRKRPCLLVGGLKPRENYKLIISNLTDKWSNQIDTSFNSCTFLGTDKIDTIPPSIFSTSPKNGEYAIPLDAEIKFFFNEPMDLKSVEDHFFLKDSSEVRVGGDMKWVDFVMFIFIPSDSFQSSFFYQAGLEGDEVFDLAGNRMADSLFKIVFNTVNPDTLGQISGRIKISSNDLYQSGQIIVVATGVGGGLSKVYRNILKSVGPYRFNNLLPGKYTLGAFMDFNENGKLDFGNPFPFVRSEPQIFYADTITVRSRWETEGINLIF